MLKTRGCHICFDGTTDGKHGSVMVTSRKEDPIKHSKIEGTQWAFADFNFSLTRIRSGIDHIPDHPKKIKTTVNEAFAWFLSDRKSVHCSIAKGKDRKYFKKSKISVKVHQTLGDESITIFIHEEGQNKYNFSHHYIYNNVLTLLTYEHAFHI